MISRFFFLMLSRYTRYPLEIKKKSRLFLLIILIAYAMIFSMVLINILLSHSFRAFIPLAVAAIGLLIVLIFFYFGRYSLSVFSFFILYFVFVTFILIFDPYDTPFELYRLSFVLTFLVIITCSVSIVSYHPLFLMAAGDLYILGHYFYRFYLLSHRGGERLVLLTLFTCLILYSSFCLFGFMIITVTKQIITIAHRNADRARWQRDSYGRFVPRQFLSILEKESIMDVSLGDHIERTMTVMFCDIRNFTALSEDMVPRENFNFINSYLSQMEPVIREHNGFIDKYIGDSIMTLFPGNADDALLCSVQMMKKLKEYNKGRKRCGYRPIGIGIGINTGLLMLGTIGGTNRMDSTVISDNVNTASRIEDLTKRFGASILFTKNTFIESSTLSKFNYRYLGTIKVKGKNRTVSIFELLDGLPEHEFKLKMKTITDFEKGTQLFQRGDIKGAKKVFKKLFHKSPGDKAVELYYKYLLNYKKRKDDHDKNLFFICDL